MKRLSAALLTIGLMAAPAHAQDFSLAGSLAQLFGGQSAQPAAHERHPSRRRAGFEAAGHADGGRSFVANASYYGGGPRRYEPNAHTASGERFNQWGLTAAHRTLPLGTRLLISHGGRSVVVRVNDRGPAAWTGRSLDVSRGAAARLGLIARGSGQVHVQVLGRG